MIRIFRLSALAFVLLAATAFGDATSYKPHATGFTLPNAQQAVSATSAQTANYAATAGSTGYATNAGTATTATTASNATYATSAGSAKTAASATTATSADSATYATSAGTASQAAGLTAGDNCPAGTALSVTKGVLSCVSSVTSITGNLNGSQIVGSITNASSINISGNIVTNGYVNGVGGLYTNTAVYSNTYDGRGGGSNATFNGNASSATTAGSTNYAASTNVGILHQNGGGGDGSSFYCDSGYHLVFYDMNVFSTNNAYFYECIRAP
jgi:hypothetical protein